MLARLCSCLDPVQAQEHYDFLDLHPALGAANSMALGINQAGTVVGYILDSATFYDRPISWSEGTGTILPLPPGFFNGYANDVNDSGVVCGQVWVHDSGLPLAFRRTGSAYTVLSTLDAQIAEGIGLRVNNSGVIAGLSYTNHSPDYRHATIWDDTTLVDLGSLSGSSFAMDINDSGLVAGIYSAATSFPRSFIYRDHTMIDLGSIPGYDYSQANGMNSKGWIVGNLTGTSGQGAFLWRPDSGMKPLTVPAGYLKPTATAVNDLGVVAGRAFVANPAGTVHPVIWKDGVMTDLNAFLPPSASFGDVSDINNAGQIVGYFYAPLKRAFLLSPPHLEITKPAFHELVRARAPYTIRWNSHGVDSIRIDYSLDSGRTYWEVTPGVAAAADSFSWQVPDTLSSKCMLLLADLKNPLDTARNPYFKIKGYVLTRFNGNGDFERYSPVRDGWKFSNDSAFVWPANWWQQFDYAGTGIDPYTGEVYPYELGFSGGEEAKPSDFPDWPLFVRSFTVDRCYWSTSFPKSQDDYRESAVLRWWSGKRSWQGSCGGFSLSSLFAFRAPAFVQDSFPSVGAFNKLNELDATAARRLMINQFQVYQRGTPHRGNLHAAYNKTPRETLQELKDMLFSDIADPAYLVVDSSRKGSHAIVPYKMYATLTPGLYLVLAYDCNYPGDSSWVNLDSLHNRWDFSGLTGWHDTLRGLYLGDPIGAYTSHPYLQSAPGARADIPARSARSHMLTPGSFELYNPQRAAVVIKNPSGDSLGFTASTSFSTIADAAPMIPFTSRYDPPMGFILPPGEYTVRMSDFLDPSAHASAFSDSLILSYARQDAQAGETDLLRFADGLSVANPDNGPKRVSLEAVVCSDSSELTFQISNALCTKGDSLVIAPVPSRAFVIGNFGGTKRYDLRLKFGSPAHGATFKHLQIQIDSSSSQRIAPDWNDLLGHALTILIDHNSTGSYDDSIVVANEVADVRQEPGPGMPRGFRLEQNNPNPFNPVTRISYELPAASHVTLRVFNVVGQVVATLVDETEAAGYQSAVWNASDAATGVYFYRLEAVDANHPAVGFTQVKKMMLIR
jgi:uncharacterized membrane protein